MTRNRKWPRQFTQKDSPKVSRQIHGKKQPETQGGLGSSGGGVGMGREDTLVFWKGLMRLGRLTIGEGVWHGDPMSSQLLESPKLVDAV